MVRLKCLRHLRFLSPRVICHEYNAPGAVSGFQVRGLNVSRSPLGHPAGRLEKSPGDWFAIGEESAGVVHVFLRSDLPGTSMKGETDATPAHIKR